MPDPHGAPGEQDPRESRIRQLEAANRAIQERNLQLVQFVNILASDLRSPLRHIMGFCRIVQHEYSAKLGGRGKSFLENVVVSARRIRLLVDDLVTITRVQQDEFRPDKVDLAEVFNYVTISLAQPIRETSARVSCGPLPRVRGSHQLLRILLQNLVDNALKYRDPERRPEIRIESERHSDHWRIAVKDNGIGIPAERFDAIFDAFQRSGEKTSYSSSGLGLFVCKEIVERHGGRIYLESEVNTGTVFYFTIAARLPQEPPL